VLNPNEARALETMRAARRPLTLAEIGAAAWPELAPEKQNSWARNAMRRLRRDKIARKTASGTYFAKPPCRRGTSNRNQRGDADDRKRRRVRMIARWGSRSGLTICCHWCGKRMHAQRGKHGYTWEVDRLTCGHLGGGYAFDNVVPSCGPCNRTRCKTAGCRFGGGLQRPDKRKEQRQKVAA
jgi:hypothetical protein